VRSLSSGGITLLLQVGLLASWVDNACTEQSPCIHGQCVLPPCVLPVHGAPCKGCYDKGSAC